MDKPPPKSEIITPPNALKKKVGSGGLDTAVLERAQEKIEKNEVDFRPDATALVQRLNASLQGGGDIEAIIYPAMQLKSQGAMFRFPLITEICDAFVTFLEALAELDQDARAIIAAHVAALSVILRENLTGDGGASGAALKKSLAEACARYYASRGVSPGG